MCEPRRPRWLFLAGWGYLRVHAFGWSMFVRRSKTHPPLFSERYGYRKVHRVLGLAIEFERTV